MAQLGLVRGLVSTEGLKIVLKAGKFRLLIVHLGSELLVGGFGGSVSGRGAGRRCLLFGLVGTPWVTMEPRINFTIACCSGPTCSSWQGTTGLNDGELRIPAFHR